VTARTWTGQSRIASVRKTKRGQCAREALRDSCKTEGEDEHDGDDEKTREGEDGGGKTQATTRGTTMRSK
jgi:hypothetical protein